MKDKSTIPLPTPPEKLHLTDEKYRIRGGYSDLERLTGTNWNEDERRPWEIKEDYNERNSISKA